MDMLNADTNEHDIYWYGLLLDSNANVHGIYDNVELLDDVKK